MRIQAAQLLSVIASWAVYSCFGSYSNEAPQRQLLTLAVVRGGASSSTSTSGEQSLLSSLLYDNDYDYDDDDDDTWQAQTQEELSESSLSLTNSTQDDGLSIQQEEEDEEGGSKSSAQRRFLDRIRLVSRSLILGEKDAVLDTTTVDDDAENYYSDHAITPQSDLTRPGRYFSVVTTASLPWMTGTAVNPLLRAAHLSRMTRSINDNDNTNTTQWVTLVIPWLELEQDRELLYHNHNFTSPEQQEQYLREWLAQEADMPDAADPDTGLRILFYPARYHSDLKSIFAMGDIVALIDDEDRADVCILEEPEHLNWFRAPGTGWSTKFSYVVGIVHTNYKDYASSQYHGLWTAPALAMISSAMVRAYCHKVIKLSDVLQTFCVEKESTSNVHGVRSDFLVEGKRRGSEIQEGSGSEEGKAYFVGKLIWQKGFDILLDLQDYYKQCTGEYFPIDIYGSGPDLKDISRAYLGRKSKNEESSSSSKTRKQKKKLFKRKKKKAKREKDKITAREQLEKIKQTIRETDFDIPKTLHELRRQPIPATFPGRKDHAELTTEYSIFINPSVSEVLCTTTAEALAMGKFVIIPVHPSNTFFLKFPNCLAYRNKFEFVANLKWAQTHHPEPLTPDLAREFTWEAATERLVTYSAISYQQARNHDPKRDERIAWFHNEVIGKGERGDTIRKVLGAGPVSHQVKYQKSKIQQSQKQQQGSESDSEEEEDEEEGFSKKFFGSQIAQSIRATLSNGLPTLIPKGQGP